MMASEVSISNMQGHICQFTSVFLFNAMLRHSFVPADFCFGMIMLSLKDKHGDASKIDMYR